MGNFQFKSCSLLCPYVKFVVFANVGSRSPALKQKFGNEIIVLVMMNANKLSFGILARKACNVIAATKVRLAWRSWMESCRAPHPLIWSWRDYSSANMSYTTTTRCHQHGRTCMLAAYSASWVNTPVKLRRHHTTNNRYNIGVT